MSNHAEAQVANNKKTEKVFSWPDLVAKEFIAAILCTVILLVYSYYVDAPLRELANPGEPENPAKAPWYFLGLQEILVYFDPWIAGVIVPSIILMGLMAIPYIDVNPKGNGGYCFWDRRFAITVFVFGFIFWYALIVVGTYMRGPFWSFFWPWETWSFDFPTPPPSVSLPNWLGIFALLIYFGLGMLVPAVAFWKFAKQLGFIRYNITMMLLLLMLGMLIKMALRLMFNVKYILQTPWFNI